MVNPLHFAVGLKQEGSAHAPRYRVVAKANEADARRAAQLAWEHGIPIVASHPEVTRRIYSAADVDSLIDESLAGDINSAWRIHLTIPSGAQLASFHDLRRQAARIGYLLDNGGALQFRDLDTTRFEPLRQDFIQPGTMRRELGDSDLKKSADFLDYCLHRIAQELCSRPGERTHVYVAVVNEADNEDPPPQQKPDPGFRTPLGATLKELSQLSHTPRFSTEDENRIASEIRSRLVALEVPVLERSVVGALSRERASFEAAEQVGLIGASHLIVYRLRRQSTRGAFDLSIRLVRISTGEIRFEDLGEFRRPRVQPVLEKLAAPPPYLRDTGRLAVLRFAPRRIPELPRSLDSLYGGLPLRLSLIEFTDRPRKKPAATKNQPIPDVPEGIDFRLGYIESGDDQGEHVLFRDLFGSHVQSIPRSDIASTSLVTSDGNVPQAHRMRHAVWRMMRHTVPIAGKIVDISGSQVELSLRRQDDIKPGERLTVIRVSESADLTRQGSEFVLPHEIILTEVNDFGCRGILADATLEPLRIGDLAHKKSEKPSVVAMLGFSTDISSLTPAQRSLLRQSMSMSDRDIESYMVHVGMRLAELLQAALVDLKVPVVERKYLEKVRSEQRLRDLDASTSAQLGRLTGATHVVVGRTSPGWTRGASVNLQVVAVETGLVVGQLSFLFDKQQMDYWTP
jgi:hypothetical protein